MAKPTDLEIAEMAPRILNRVLIKRTSTTDYVTAGDANAYDTMIEFEWNGKRYRVGVYEV